MNTIDHSQEGYSTLSEQFLEFQTNNSGVERGWLTTNKESSVSSEGEAHNLISLMVFVNVETIVPTNKGYKMMNEKWGCDYYLSLWW